MVDEKKEKKISKQCNQLEFNGKIYKTISAKRTAQTKYWNKTIEELKNKEQTKEIKDVIKLIEKKKEQEEQNKEKEYYNNLKKVILQLKKELKELIKSKSSNTKIKKLRIKINNNAKIYNDWTKLQKKKKDDKLYIDELKKNKLFDENDIEEKKTKKQKYKSYKKRITQNVYDDNYESNNSVEKILTANFIRENQKTNEYLHKIQISNFVKPYKNLKNVIYKHEILYFEDDIQIDVNNYEIYNPITEEIEYLDLSKKSNTFIFTHYNKNKGLDITYRMSGANYIWKVRQFLAVSDNNKVIIRTLKYDKKIYFKRDGEQIYRENIDNSCFYDGVLQFFNNLYENKPNKNIKTIINKLINNEEKYKKPYTEQEIQTFCEELKISITIKNYITCEDININYNKNNYYNIEFINSKYNHLDLLINPYNIEEINYEEYEKIKKDSTFYIEKLGELITINKTYKKKRDEFDLLHKKWREAYKINNNFIYTTSQEYKLLDTYDYNLHRFFNLEKYTGIETDYIELDVKKAYFNELNIDFNKYYIGFPSGSFINYKCVDFHIKDFKEQINNKLIGYYQVKIINTKKNFDLLGFKKGSIHTLFSSVINLLCHYMDFEFINISIAPSIDIKFNDEFLNKNDKGLSHYVKAFGILFKENTEILTIIKPLDNDKEFYKTFYNEKYDVFEDNGLFFIKNDIENPKSYKHIAFTFHSYLTTIILNELINMDLDNVIGVKLDSIIIKKSYDYKFDNKIFKEKKPYFKHMIENINNNGDLDFGIDENDFDIPSLDDDIVNYVYENTYKLNCDIVDDFKPLIFDECKTINKRIIFCGGAGGTGKTYSIMNSGINLKNVCYTTLSWDLIQNKIDEYPEIIGLSHQKITGEADGEKCEKILNNNIKYIVVDELTLIHKKTIDKIINDYNDKFIFLLGDITSDGHSFQCQIYNDIYKHNQESQYIEFKKTYRFDDELNEMIKKVRDDQIKNKDSLYNICLHKKSCKQIFKDRFYKKEDVIFNDNDIGIIATKNKTEEITNYFINKGTKPKYFIKNTDLKKGQMTGQELNEIPSHSNYEMKLFKTIHSFQGRELKKEQKIIIYIDKYFDYNLFYTAISRARNLKQIYIIE